MFADFVCLRHFDHISFQQRGGCSAAVPEGAVWGQTHRRSGLLLGRGRHTLPCPAVSRDQSWRVSLWCVISVRVFLIPLQYYRYVVLKLYFGAERHARMTNVQNFVLVNMLLLEKTNHIQKCTHTIQSVCVQAEKYAVVD